MQGIVELAEAKQVRYMCPASYSWDDEDSPCDHNPGTNRPMRAAYVRQPDHGLAPLVIICPDYWHNEMMFSDHGDETSQVGTLIHEYAHANGAADVRAGNPAVPMYGEAACSTLAARDPMQAARNADNYRYFVMNRKIKND
jgi:hypothetical protein